MPIIHKTAKGILCVALASGAMRAKADSITELGDAGQLLPSAQLTTGSGAITDIYGTLSNVNDVDLFAISIVDPAAFSANTFSTPQIADPYLTLFDSSGLLVAYNDDDDDGDPHVPQSELKGFAGAAGTYYIALSSFKNIPDNLFAGGPLTGWSNEGISSGDYHITLAGASASGSAAAAAPLPGVATAGLALLGGIALRRGRRPTIGNAV